ncbi:MAG: CTP synthetase [Halobacteriaceae archaeon]
MNVVIVGPDRGLGNALRQGGANVNRVTGPAGKEPLLDAGLERADVLIITDANEATAIPVARDIVPDIKVIAYTPETMPEFVAGVLDIAIDPQLLDADIVAEEIQSAIR